MEHRIEVVDYDPSRPDVFERDRAAREDSLAPWLAGPITHIGSTAVPGLCAVARELQGALAIAAAGGSREIAHAPRRATRELTVAYTSSSTRTDTVSVSVPPPR
jgi:hypothetical protein